MKTVEVIKATANIIDRSKGIGQGRQLRVAPYCRVSTEDEYTTGRKTNSKFVKIFKVKKL